MTWRLALLCDIPPLGHDSLVPEYHDDGLVVHLVGIYLADAVRDESCETAGKRSVAVLSLQMLPACPRHRFAHGLCLFPHSLWCPEFSNLREGAGDCRCRWCRLRGTASRTAVSSLPVDALEPSLRQSSSRVFVTHSGVIPAATACQRFLPLRPRARAALRGDSLPPPGHTRTCEESQAREMAVVGAL